jgi:hypothetical protein
MLAGLGILGNLVKMPRDSGHQEQQILAQGDKSK